MVDNLILIEKWPRQAENTTFAVLNECFKKINKLDIVIFNHRKEGTVKKTFLCVCPFKLREVVCFIEVFVHR